MSRSLRASSLLAAIAVASLGLAGCAAEGDTITVAAPSDNGPDDLRAGITVSATGEVRGAPDTLEVVIGSEVSGVSVQESVDASARISDQILAAAGANGVSEDDVQTRDYAIQPQVNFTPAGVQVTQGYLVRNTFVVRITDLDNAGKAIDAMSVAGGDNTRLASVQFLLEDDSVALDEARADAMTQTVDKARQLAELGGSDLGKLEAVTDVRVATAQPFYRELEGLSGSQPLSAAIPESAILEGEVTTSVTVRVRFALA